MAVQTKNAYPLLLSGIEIRGKLFKNRLISTNSLPHYIQGDEGHPDRAVITHLANRAKRGAAVVTMSGIFSKLGPRSGLPSQAADMIGLREPRHFPVYDIYEPQHQNYFAQFVDEVHFYNSRACIALQFPFIFDEWAVNGGDLSGAKMYTPGMIGTVIDSYAEQAAVARDIGFDMCSLHVAYGAPFAGSFLNPLLNHRTDEYGGSLENRARVCLELLRAVKERAGRDFIVQLLMSGEDTPGGNTTEDYCELLKMADGLVDILEVRSPELDPNHPTGYMADPNPTLRWAARFKKLGLEMKIAPVGGFQDPEAAERALREGEADMIAAARAFICEPDYIAKIREGRAEDIVPCIRCNKCHAISRKGLIRTACSVNPEYGLEHDLHNLISAPGRVKKVAVIGGGPGGMEAALRAANRGHAVTLFERDVQLGGTLNAACVPDFKWPVRLYRDYLERQIAKSAVEVRLGTKATPMGIVTERFDAVLIAIGAEPVVPSVPGASRCVTGADALLHPEKIKGDVAVIGGGEAGVEVAMHLCRLGHTVTILEMKDELAEDSPPQHYRNYMLKCAAETEGLRWILGARVTAVEGNTVSFVTGAEGERAIKADTVVAAAGTRAKTRDAMRFIGCAPEYAAVGDCYEAGSIMTAVRSAYGATSIL
ncbi:MAG: FAD-dependent oxidoreductase [Oscillospiraceae bacterium]|nr:FAD-dependent oxidoreductase [Oscillospiraceae bacterium]